MCGLFGIIYNTATTVPDAKRLNQTLELLRQRGLDGCGVNREPGLGLAHTRLSLVDLNERSAQPFWAAGTR